MEFLRKFKAYFFTGIFALFLFLSFNFPSLWFLSLIALAPLFKRNQWKTYLYYGFLFYFLMYLPVFKAFILVSDNYFYAIVLFFLFIVAITLFQFGLTWLLNRFILFLPLSWVLVEILRLYFPYGGFPFDYLGLVFSYIPYAQNLLAFIGIFGGSFLILLFNFLIYKIFENPFWDKERKLYITALSLLSIVLISTGYWLEKKIEFSYKNLKMAIIQPFFHPLKGLSEEKLYSLINKVPENVDLIFLPESSLSAEDNITALAQKFPNRNFILGKTSIEFDFKSLQLYALNTAVYIREGKVVAVYVKRKLLPFGEYTPFPFGWLGKIIPYFNGLDYKEGNKEVLFIYKGISFLPKICFEIAFPIRANAEFIVNLTNDGWFYKLFVKRHFYHARLQALLKIKPVIFVNNNGYSGIILPDGSFLKPQKKIYIDNKPVVKIYSL